MEPTDFDVEAADVCVEATDCSSSKRFRPVDFIPCFATVTGFVGVVWLDVSIRVLFAAWKPRSSKTNLRLADKALIDDRTLC